MSIIEARSGSTLPILFIVHGEISFTELHKNYEKTFSPLIIVSSYFVFHFERRATKGSNIKIYIPFTILTKLQFGEAWTNRGEGGGERTLLRRGDKSTDKLYNFSLSPLYSFYPQRFPISDLESLSSPPLSRNGKPIRSLGRSRHGRRTRR